MKYEIYTATDKKDGAESFFLVKPSTGEAVSIYRWSESQIDYLFEHAELIDESGGWFTSSEMMGDDKILLREFEA
jgi:hypothetical protein|nr:MAG TPA: hypothetical protein [Caudoviricetes sp.]